MPLIERAVIVAAGEGVRLRPATLTTPKPLLPINGTRMIDTVIGALRANGVDEIYVVTGYKAEQYASLPAQYPGLTLLYNPYYETCNNISSAYVARAHLENAIISEADLLLHNPDVCRREFARSCYCAYPGRAPQEWTLTLDADGTVTRCDKDGGSGTCQLLGISFWTQADGRKLRTQLEQAFIRDKLRDVYWDELPLFLYGGEYKLGVREITRGDCVEVDTLQELAAIDGAYEGLLAKARQ